MINIKKIHPLISVVNRTVIDLPTPPNISLWWNIGSILGLCLILQIITGLFLSIHYTRNILLSFDRVIHIMRDVNYGWLIRFFHANGASLFFICIYTHIGRGIYYSSFFFQEVWLIGVIILFAVIGTAFIGYVLPWGQISFWGATVITNLISAVPYLGNFLVQWVWGGFAVDNATLNRFYTIHFLLPFVIILLSVIHIIFIHLTGSNNPLGIDSNKDKIPFHPYFSFKDIVGFSITLILLTSIILISPNLLGDAENFIPSNPLVTPVHIQPEWYFLFAYAILRSIPNKLGGVISLVLSISILFILPFSQKSIIRGKQFYPLSQINFWFMVNSVILLTWIGARPVEDPYIITGQILTLLYFSYFLINPLSLKFWDKLLINK